MCLGSQLLACRWVLALEVGEHSEYWSSFYESFKQGVRTACSSPTGGCHAWPASTAIFYDTKRILRAGSVRMYQVASTASSQYCTACTSHTDGLELDWHASTGTHLCMRCWHTDLRRCLS